MGKVGIVLIGITFLALTVFGVFFIIRINSVQTLQDKIYALKNQNNRSSTSKNSSSNTTPETVSPRFALFIVLDDAGISLDEVLPLEKFKGSVSIAIVPKLHASKSIADFLYKRNISYMIHLPMEPIGDNDPGKYALYTDASTDELKTHIATNFSDFDNYLGFNNHMGSKAVMDERVMDTLFSRLDRKMIVLDSRTTHKSILQEKARTAGMTALRRDIFIDNFDDLLYIKAQIRLGVQTAKKQHAAILIGHTTKTYTFKAIEAMYDEVTSQNGVFLGLQDYKGFMSAFE